MKLFYYQRPDKATNFGDDLNQWLWPKLAPELFETASHPFKHDDTVFVGTGTLLNHRLASRLQPANKLIIFGTGAGYEQPLQTAPLSWKICCVRGPLSAKQLGLPAQTAITDGGLLIAKAFTPSASVNTERVSCSFMPHVHSASDAGDRWQRICQLAGIRYIDPRWPVEQVLNAINSSDRLLTEAMHGAIAADALRVPWIPVTTTPRIYAFKWQDWCASMDVFYHPYRLPALKQYHRWGRGLRSGSVALRHWFGAALEGPVSTPYYELSGDESAIAKRLLNISRQATVLSSDATFDRQLDRLQQSFSQLRSRYAVPASVGAV